METDNTTQAQKLWHMAFNLRLSDVMAFQSAAQTAENALRILAQAATTRGVVGDRDRMAFNRQQVEEVTDRLRKHREGLHKAENALTEWVQTHSYPPAEKPVVEEPATEYDLEETVNLVLTIRHNSWIDPADVAELVHTACSKNDQAGDQWQVSQVTPLALTDVEKALKVMVINPRIRQFLQVNDPKALGQAIKALGQEGETL